MAGVNKVNYGNQVVIDISDSTVSPSTLLEGVKAYGANGDPVTGTLKLAYHITLTPEQYLELTPEERKASDCWYYLKGVKKAGGLFQRPANSGWQLTEDEVTIYNYNSHEIMIAAANGSIYVELQNGWNNISELPSDYAPGSVLTFSAFFEDTTTWVISPIMMRVRPNGMIDVASEGAHNGNLYFSYNYLRENPETDDAWYYTQASNVPYATIDDTTAGNDTTWSGSKIVNELSNVNTNIGTAVSGVIRAVDITSDVTITAGTSAQHKVIKKGGFCYVYIPSFVPTATGDNKVIATGLPKSAMQMGGTVGGMNSAQSAAINGAGTVCWIPGGSTSLYTHFGANSSGRQHWIYLAYPIAND